MTTQNSNIDPILAAVQTAIEAIRFGSVEIVIHDSKVVQIERKEKVRFNTTQTVTDRTSGSSDTSDIKRSQS